ncbi:cytochrome b [Paraburkholderia phenoliruptrix]|uniref:Cytochrome b/b6 domain-containing protein n=2 Tax=Paraburkholderia phenoliruptrix TaxID=252970 RepID=K0DTL4_9BURK|nr:cytochrome b [Paraburkholderia phenoliruptrix]AFT88022.1 cytochrome b/b6 domain-containing protein [Paraburkholderia phenoliruptrix BR3459a]MDR6418263.1 cytochrome b561 [Paraburkholderia phenoliruptrix]WMY12236.1 cytochrome b [Paraburkholderia phenoliruptrix]CAB4046932.1 Cytochrome b561 [Paraburkholderia phenoliruptrix]
MTTVPTSCPERGADASAPRYAGSMIALHWLIAFGIIGLLALGLYMVGLPKGLPVKATLLNLHKSIGLTVFLLVLLRIAARAAFHRPPLPPMRPWQRAAARTTQGLLYVAMVAMPVSGYLGSSFNRYGTRFWGLPLPKWGWDDAGLRELFFGIHEIAAYVLIALIVLHVAGALKHQWIDRDNLLARMLP